MDIQQNIIDRLPGHLQAFVTVQDYDAYTARDHAIWRFLMRQLRQRLETSAHPVYLEGLTRTGISTEYIPSIEEMNQCLADIGWRALVVDGFIPPAIFMEFQSLRILVIAQNMRTIEQVLYTPAPDILHESAGHAPFLVDVDYAEFLQKFGEVGMRALSSDEDQAVYEAIRHLSIVKEKPSATSEEIALAEKALEEAQNAITAPSEATLLARLHWWTVEYGLVGTLEDYRIFGAGLLSSLGESEHCLDDARVAKHLLTLDALERAYDITTEQQHLYVTHSCRHLSQVLEQMAQRMAFRCGGPAALERAHSTHSVSTVTLDTGLQVSGVIAEPDLDPMGNPVYLRTRGPTQLAFKNTELPGHGIDTHADGFGCPLGLVSEFSHCLSTYTIDELAFAGIAVGKAASLEFVSGIHVQGRLIDIVRRNQRNILLSFEDCTVTDSRGGILFNPDWGTFDMAIGSHLVSVAGGSADASTYPLYDPPAEKSRPAAHGADDQQLFREYQKVRQWRESGVAPGAQDVDRLLAAYPQEWLLLYEIAEIQPGAEKVIQRLKSLREQPGLTECITIALNALNPPG